jgi:hypothetical protein
VRRVHPRHEFPDPSPSSVPHTRTPTPGTPAALDDTLNLQAYETRERQMPGLRSGAGAGSQMPGSGSGAGAGSGSQGERDWRIPLRLCDFETLRLCDFETLRLQHGPKLEPL